MGRGLTPASHLAVFVCLSVGLTGCASPDAQTFIDRYRLQPNVGALYEIVARGEAAGWLYSAVHYGTVEQPSMSGAAVQAMTQTRHVYLENTDRPGNSWPMRYAVAEDLEGATQAKRKAALASPDKVRQALIAAKRLEKESDGVAVVLSQDRSYYEHWALTNNYCGVFYEYGTERLARVFATGKDITIHSLETEASRRAALEQANTERCQREPAAKAGPPPGNIEQPLERICEAILHDVSRDQREGRPHAVTSAAACVLDGRHRTMAARIARAAKAGERPFVIVGRGHLMPGENLIDLLKEQGLALRRID
jgi:hypothetical protein